MSAPAPDVVRRKAEQLRKWSEVQQLPPEFLAQLADLCADNWAVNRMTVAERKNAIDAMIEAAEALQRAFQAADLVDLIGIGKETLEGALKYLPELVSSCGIQRAHLESLPRTGRRPPKHAAQSLVAFVAHNARKHGIDVGLSEPFLTIITACLEVAGIRADDGRELDPVPLVKNELAHHRLLREIAGR
ncbi:MAG: hypothetical protein Q8M01_15860 [Rubrivivax sp.]|nr:hypothetical protein [Rubrivivax sp.]